MFRRKKPAQKYADYTRHELDSALVMLACGGETEKVRKLVAAGANVHYDNDRAWRYAVVRGDTETMRVLLDAGVDVHQHNDYALHCHPLKWRSAEYVQLVREAISKQDARREKEKNEKLELERERNPLLAGAGFTLMKFTPEDIGALLREAIDLQSARPGPPHRDHIFLPQP